MKAKNKMEMSTTDREIVAVRIFNAPRKLVFEAWTDPEQVALWWGPNGFTNTIHQMNVKPEGVWLFTMHGPDGTDYPNKIVFQEVQKPSRLVYIHGEPDQPDNFHVTVTFEDMGDKTKLTMKMLFDTKEKRDEVVEKYGAEEGLQQTLGRLDAYLKGENYE